MAIALHNSGKGNDAGHHFASSERIELESPTEFVLPLALQGFQYCDWLLVTAERAAWQSVFGIADSMLLSTSQEIEGVTTTLDAVEHRATTTLSRKLADRDSILEIALDKLTLTRVCLMRAILLNLTPPITLGQRVNEAVEDLRVAGQLNYLPSGLLTAAWYYSLVADKAATKTSLAEAQKIAERGQMPLFLADIHLYRASFPRRNRTRQGRQAYSRLLVWPTIRRARGR